MLHRVCPKAPEVLAIWLILVAVLVSSIPTAEARRRRRRKRPKTTETDTETRQLAMVGNPKIVVVRRKHVKAFRLASSAFRKDLVYPTGEVVLDPTTPPKELLEDIAEDDHTFTELTVLDSAGRLQIPKEYREQFEIRRRVQLELHDDGILIRPVVDQMDRGADAETIVSELAEAKKTNRLQKFLGRWAPKLGRKE